MKNANKLLAALCLALIACLAVPALLPAELDTPFSARAAMSISRTKAVIYNGKTLKLKVTGTSRTVQWSSSNKKVATVSSSGLVTAKKVGKATITAKAGGKTLSCLVTVKSSLTASTTAFTLGVGKTKQVILTNKVTSGLTLDSYDPGIVRCTFGKIKNGKCTLTVRAKGAGTQTLVVRSAKTGDAVKIKVTVKGKTIPTPTARPTVKPTARPTVKPTVKPTEKPTPKPTVKPTATPTATPTDVPPIVDRTSVTVAKGKSATVHVTWPYSGVPHMWYNDSSVVNVTWGEWSNNGWPLTIKGVGAGTAKVWFTKGDDSTDTPLATIKVTVK